MQEEKKEYVSQEEIIRLSKFLEQFFLKNNLSPDEILGLLISMLTSGIANISKHSVDKEDTFALDRLIRHVTIPTLSRALNSVANELKAPDRYEINCIKYDVNSVN